MNEEQLVYAVLNWVANNNQNNTGIDEIKKEQQEIQQIISGIMNDMITPSDVKHTVNEILNEKLNEIKTNNNTKYNPNKTPIKPSNKPVNTKKTLYEGILSILPEYTQEEWDTLSKDVKEQYAKYNTKKEQDKLLENYMKRNDIQAQLGLSIATANNILVEMVKKGLIFKTKVNPNVNSSPNIYAKIKSNSQIVKDDDGNDEYIFTNKPSNPGYMLIGNKNIKPKKGKGKNGPLELTIDMVYYLKKNVLKDNPIFTNAMYDESYKYLTSRGVNSMSVEGYLSHIVDGHFDNILKEYEEYLISDANPRFETENNQLIVNGVNTKLQIKEVQKIIDNIPFGQSDDKLEDYIKKVGKQYVFCKVECIRTIIDNYDNIVLDGIIIDTVIDEIETENEAYYNLIKGDDV